jgi:hypothetical protein
VHAAIVDVGVALVPGGAVAGVPGAVARLEADAVRAPARVHGGVSPRRRAARGVPDGPVQDHGHGEIPGPVVVGAGEPEAQNHMASTMNA